MRLKTGRSGSHFRGRNSPGRTRRVEFFGALQTLTNPPAFPSSKSKSGTQNKVKRGRPDPNRQWELNENESVLSHLHGRNSSGQIRIEELFSVLWQFRNPLRTLSSASLRSGYAEPGCPPCHRLSLSRQATETQGTMLLLAYSPAQSNMTHALFSTFSWSRSTFPCR